MSSHNRSDRPWVRGYTLHEGKRIGCHTIKCSSCTQEKKLIDRGNVQMPFDQISKKFIKAGWLVGKNERRDMCPSCIESKTAASRVKHYKPKENVVNFPTPAPTEIPMTVTMPDRPMNREEKRLINMKLHEVYIGEKYGYYPPHTDQSVAKDMGVPVAWVRDIREELFGPAHSNSEIDDQLAKIETVKAEVVALAAAVDHTLNEIKMAVSKIPPLSDRMSEIKRVCESLTRQA